MQAVVTSSIDMPKKRPPDGRLDRPHGEKISISDEDRLWIKSEREARGWTHRELGARAGCSAATVSNVETGRTGQPYKSVLAGIYRALKAKNENEASAFNSTAYTLITEGSLDLSPEDMRLVADFIERLRGKR